MRILRLISKGRNGFVNSVAKAKAKGYWQVGPAVRIEFNWEFN